MTPEDWIKSQIEVSEERIDNERHKVLKHPSGITKYLPINATDEDIENAKNQIVQEVLYAYEVVESEIEPEGYMLKPKEFD